MQVIYKTLAEVNSIKIQLDARLIKFPTPKEFEIYTIFYSNRDMLVTYSIFSDRRIIKIGSVDLIFNKGFHTRFREIEEEQEYIFPLKKITQN